jgi:hypothetical protein
MEDGGSVRDRVVVESERVGQPAREGEILEVLGTGEVIHYRVRWDDGHETTLYPSAGSLRIIRRAAKTASP